MDHRKLSFFIHAYGIAFLFRSGKNPGGYSNFLAHLSRRLIGELIVYRSSRRPSVRPSVRPFVRPSVHIFKHEFLCNQLVDWNEILSEASLGLGKGFSRF